MQYIIIENFNGYINIIQYEDDMIVFDSLKEAKESLEDCQTGVIIPLGIDIITLLSQCRDIIINNVDEPFIYTKHYQTLLKTLTDILI